MAEKNKKQFGVWMDTHHATIVGRANNDEGTFVILAHEKSGDKEGNSNERTGDNAENNKFHKLFKTITSHMQNVDEIHVTGTGVAQEQFIKYLANTPQYKNAVATESTSNKMSDENLLEYVAAKFK
jgi:stalled ribosome rescue protein Dom34